MSVARLVQTYSWNLLPRRQDQSSSNPDASLYDLLFQILDHNCCMLRLQQQQQQRQQLIRQLEKEPIKEMQETFLFQM